MSAMQKVVIMDLQHFSDDDGEGCGDPDVAAAPHAFAAAIACSPNSAVSGVLGFVSTQTKEEPEIPGSPSKGASAASSPREDDDRPSLQGYVGEDQDTQSSKMIEQADKKAKSQDDSPVPSQSPEENEEAEEEENEFFDIPDHFEADQTPLDPAAEPVSSEQLQSEHDEDSDGPFEGGSNDDATEEDEDRDSTQSLAIERVPSADEPAPAMPIDKTAGTDVQSPALADPVVTDESGGGDDAGTVEAVRVTMQLDDSVLTDDNEGERAVVSLEDPVETDDDGCEANVSPPGVPTSAGSPGTQVHEEPEERGRAVGHESTESNHEDEKEEEADDDDEKDDDDDEDEEEEEEEEVEGEEEEGPGREGGTEEEVEPIIASSVEAPRVGDEGAADDEIVSRRDIEIEIAQAPDTISVNNEFSSLLSFFRLGPEVLSVGAGASAGPSDTNENTASGFDFNLPNETQSSDEQVAASSALPVHEPAVMLPPEPFLESEDILGNAARHVGIGGDDAEQLRPPTPHARVVSSDATAVVRARPQLYPRPATPRPSPGGRDSPHPFGTPHQTTPFLWGPDAPSAPPADQVLASGTSSEPDPSASAPPFLVPAGLARRVFDLPLLPQKNVAVQPVVVVPDDIFVMEAPQPEPAAADGIAAAPVPALIDQLYPLPSAPPEQAPSLQMSSRSPSPDAAEPATLRSFGAWFRRLFSAGTAPADDQAEERVVVAPRVTEEEWLTKCPQDGVNTRTEKQRCALHLLLSTCYSGAVLMILLQHFHMVWFLIIMEMFALVLFLGIHTLAFICTGRPALERRHANVFLLLDAAAIVFQSVTVVTASLLLNALELAVDVDDTPPWKSGLDLTTFRPPETCSSSSLDFVVFDVRLVHLGHTCGELQFLFLGQVVGGTILLLFNSMRALICKAIRSVAVHKITDGWSGRSLVWHLALDVFFPLAGLLWVRQVDPALRAPLHVNCCAQILCNAARWRLWVSGSRAYEAVTWAAFAVQASIFAHSAVNEDWATRAQDADAGRVAVFAVFAVGWTALLAARAVQGRHTVAHIFQRGVDPERNTDGDDNGEAAADKYSLKLRVACSVFLCLCFAYALAETVAMLVATSKAHTWTAEQSVVHSVACVASVVCLQWLFLRKDTHSSLLLNYTLVGVCHLYLLAATAWSGLNAWDLGRSERYISLNAATLFFVHTVTHVVLLSGKQSTETNKLQIAAGVLTVLLVVTYHDHRSDFSDSRLSQALVLLAGATAVLSTLRIMTILPPAPAGDPTAAMQQRPPRAHVLASILLSALFWVVVCASCVANGYALVFDKVATVRSSIATVGGIGMVCALLLISRRQTTWLFVLVDCVLVMLAVHSTTAEHGRDGEAGLLSRWAFGFGATQFVLGALSEAFIQGAGSEDNNNNNDQATIVNFIKTKRSAIVHILTDLPLVILKLWHLSLCTGWLPAISLVTNIHALIRAIQILIPARGEANQLPSWEDRGLTQWRGPGGMYLVVTVTNFLAMVWVVHEESSHYQVDLGLGAITWGLILLLQSIHLDDLILCEGCLSTWAQHALQFTFVARIAVRLVGLPSMTSWTDFAVPDQVMVGCFGLFILALRVFFCYVCFTVPRTSDAQEYEYEEVLSAVQMGAKLLEHAFCMGAFAYEALRSHDSILRTVVYGTSACVSLLVIDIIFRTLRRPIHVWGCVLVADLIIGIPPVVVQLYLGENRGDLWQSILFGFQVLFITRALGFDLLIVSEVYEETERERKTVVKCLLPAVVVGLSSWVLLTISMHQTLDSKVLLLQCVTCSVSLLCTFLYSGFFLTYEKEWPATHITLVLENIFSAVLTLNVVVHGYLLRYGDPGQMAMFQTHFYIHLVLLLALMACRSVFREDWQSVRKMIWVPNYLLEVLDLISIFFLYRGTDGEEEWFTWFLFAEFAGNLVLFECGQNFWKTERLVVTHVAIFDVLSDVPLVGMVFYKALNDGFHPFSRTVNGFPLQAFTFTVNVVIFCKSLIAGCCYYIAGSSEQDDGGAPDDDDHDAIDANDQGDALPPEDKPPSMWFVSGLQAVKIIAGLVLGWHLLFPQPDAGVTLSIRVSGLTTEDFDYQTRQNYKAVIASGLTSAGVPAANVHIDSFLDETADASVSGRRQWDSQTLAFTQPSRRLSSVSTNHSSLSATATAATAVVTSSFAETSAVFIPPATAPGTSLTPEAATPPPSAIVAGPYLILDVRVTCTDGYHAMEVADTLDRFVSDSLTSLLQETTPEVDMAVIAKPATVFDHSECGDGETEAWEDCDDGNVEGGDGCSAACTVETGYLCTEEDGTGSVCAFSIGRLAFDPSPGTFRLNKHSNAKLQVRIIALDDPDVEIEYSIGNVTAVYTEPITIDEVSIVHIRAVGRKEGYPNTPWLEGIFEVTQVCGDGVQDDQEQCDDANDINDDLCSQSCKFPMLGTLAFDPPPGSFSLNEWTEPDLYIAIDYEGRAKSNTEIWYTTSTNHSTAPTALPQWPWDGAERLNGELMLSRGSLSVSAIGVRDGVAVTPPVSGNFGISSVCGDGVVAAAEQCDDAGRGDACSRMCQFVTQQNDRQGPSQSEQDQGEEREDGDDSEEDSPPYLFDLSVRWLALALCVTALVISLYERRRAPAPTAENDPARNGANQPDRTAQQQQQQQQERVRDRRPQRRTGGARPSLAGSRRRKRLARQGIQVQQFQQCATCGDEFEETEGVSCCGRDPHWACRECFTSYVKVACEAGGAMTSAQVDGQGQVTSEAGQLPCAYFPSSCTVGALSLQRLTAMLSETGLPDADEAFQTYMSAVQRVAVDRYIAEEQERMRVERQNARGLVDIARARVQEALLHGQSVTCPGCRNPKRKDGACMHMTCDCGVHFCYVCGKDRYPGVRGTRSTNGYTSRNKVDCGCDSKAIYLQGQPGWGGLDRRGENYGDGALAEFHRQRMAYFVRFAKQSVDAGTWQELQRQHPSLLTDVISGRSIGWGEVDAAEHPQFGTGRAREEARRAGEELSRQWQTG